MLTHNPTTHSMSNRPASKPSQKKQQQKPCLAQSSRIGTEDPHFWEVWWDALKSDTGGSHWFGIRPGISSSSSSRGHIRTSTGFVGLWPAWKRFQAGKVIRDMTVSSTDFETSLKWQVGESSEFEVLACTGCWERVHTHTPAHTWKIK